VAAEQVGPDGTRCGVGSASRSGRSSVGTTSSFRDRDGFGGAGAEPAWSAARSGRRRDCGCCDKPEVRRDLRHRIGEFANRGRPARGGCFRSGQVGSDAANRTAGLGCFRSARIGAVEFFGAWRRGAWGPSGFDDGGPAGRLRGNRGGLSRWMRPGGRVWTGPSAGLGWAASGSGRSIKNFFRGWFSALLAGVDFQREPKRATAASVDVPHGATTRTWFSTRRGTATNSRGEGFGFLGLLKQVLGHAFFANRGRASVSPANASGENSGGENQLM